MVRYPSQTQGAASIAERPGRKTEQKKNSVNGRQRAWVRDHSSFFFFLALLPCVSVQVGRVDSRSDRHYYGQALDGYAYFLLASPPFFSILSLDVRACVRTYIHNTFALGLGALRRGWVWWRARTLVRFLLNLMAIFE